MWLAHYFPGLHLRVDDVGRLTPEQTAALEKAGAKVLEHEEKLKTEHTKAIMKTRVI